MKTLMTSLVVYRALVVYRPLWRCVIAAILLVLTMGARSNDDPSVSPGDRGEVRVSTVLRGGFPQHQELNVCVLIWEPIAYERDGRMTGLMVELARVVIERVGYNPVFRSMAALRCNHEVQNRHMNLALFTSEFTISQSNGELQAIQPSVLSQLNTLMVPYDHPLQSFQGLGALKELRIGAIRGNSYARQHALSTDAKWELVNSVDALWKMLNSNRIDAVLGDYQSLLLTNPEHQKKIRFLLPPVDSSPLYWSVHKDNRELANQLSLQLSQLLKTGVVDDLYLEFLGVSYSQIQSMIESQEFLPSATPRGKTEG